MRVFAYFLRAQKVGRPSGRNLGRTIRGALPAPHEERVRRLPHSFFPTILTMVLYHIVLGNASFFYRLLSWIRPDTATGIFLRPPRAAAEWCWMGFHSTRQNSAWSEMGM